MFSRALTEERVRHTNINTHSQPPADFTTGVLPWYRNSTVIATDLSRTELDSSIIVTANGEEKSRYVSERSIQEVLLFVAHSFS